VNLKFARQFNLRRPPQCLAQNLSFDLELMFVACVLVVAPAAALKLLAARFHSIRRRRRHPVERRARESRLLLGQHRVNFFAFKHKWHKNGFAGATIIGWQPG